MRIYVEVYNHQGKRVRRVRTRSFVRGWITLLHRCFNSAVTSAANSVSQTQQNELDVRAGVGIDTRGVLVGTGTTPVQETDTALDAQIPHGSDPGQLSYGSVAVSLATVEGAQVVQVDRTFENQTGADIEIREVGLVVRHDPTTNANQNLLIERTVLGTPITIPSLGGTVTVRYRITP